LIYPEARRIDRACKSGQGVNSSRIGFSGSGLPSSSKCVTFPMLNPSICICCGEPMARGGGALSRNPNMCASCSSMADGMRDPVSVVPPGVSQLSVSAPAELAGVHELGALHSMAELAVPDTSGPAL